MEDAFNQLALLIPSVMLVTVRIGVAFALLPAPFGSGSPPIVRALAGLGISATIVSAHGPFDITLDPSTSTP